MGLLDDAIREHLDLKRRRGADPAEIERAERDALGPVRRNREPGAGDEAEAAAAGSEPAVGSALDEPDEGVASDLIEEPYGDEEYDDEPLAAPAQSAGYLEDEGGFDDEEPLPEDEVFGPGGDEPLADEEDPHRTQLMQTVDIPAPEDATARHDVERSFEQGDARGAQPRGADHEAAEDDGEDVLEETPEFLQDTPDHDRLWFEQRPPRDFDFDG